MYRQVTDCSDVIIKFLLLVAAFGEDYNDVEMLRECGISVAVSTAIDEVKAVADDICGDCDEDGVARWLEENVL
ncbi:MAG TPA: HAD hydrolase family protein [Methylomusa anaerophila]|uniref:Putative phosphatase n=1 Tax=Methylomusa anaerophila TaxID=1930071 RepID=A0A348AF79_9FIRM|nr:HAD hydrolase family protein [Methylomusa anaerophila]BBB89727.1 putative phosphatase [Methylomusa anaerophila]HML89228.1 HAD hydrolase family protein [Methylomusa anaerophila]